MLYYKLAKYCYVLYIWHFCQDSYRLSNKKWLEERSRLVKKRLWLTKTIVTSFKFVGIKGDNFQLNNA